MLPAVSDAFPKHSFQALTGVRARDKFRHGGCPNENSGGSLDSGQADGLFPPQASLCLDEGACFSCGQVSYGVGNITRYHRYRC